jgi:hypothetical protein
MSDITLTQPLPDVLKKRHIAILIDKSERTVERLVRSGQLPAPLIPGRWSRVVIERWLEGGTSGRRGRR